MVVYVTKYNNYFNRIVRKFTDISDYLSNDWKVTPNANFNEGDGVTTSFVANTSLRGDYLIVTDESLNILSRWFILGSKCMRNGQYSLSLRRDLLADYYDDYVNQPFYCEKATLEQNDPMIFNSEGMIFNKIKKSENDLWEDDVPFGYIVGYTQIPSDISASIKKDYKGTTDYISISSLSNWDYYKYSVTSSTATPTKYFAQRQSMELGLRVYNPNASSGTITSAINYVDENGNISRKISYYSGDKFKAADNYPTISGLLSKTSFNTILNTYLSLDDDKEFMQLNGKTIYDRTAQKYYKINVQSISETTIKETKLPGSSGTIFTQIYNAAVADTGTTISQNDDLFFARYQSKNCRLYLEETVNISGDLVVTKDDYNNFFKKAKDADYCIFVIPCPHMDMPANFNDKSWAYYTQTYSYKKSMAMAQLLVEALGKSNLIDLQLLPYCPIKTSADILSRLFFRKSDTDEGYIGEAYCIANSSFEGNIDYSIKVDDKKVSSECDIYRLVSPNFANTFEFSPAKNGNVSFFHYKATYKPYTPYINIHPYFENLYGQDFDDNRGLILGGDFSLPITSDAFTEYQINNKNYSNIFDRQMQNLDKQNAWSGANAVTGAIAGTVQGAAIGAMAGPAGAIAGGVASAIGGAADIAQSAVMMKENKDMQKDMYSYQLGNIDSKPNTLVKSSAFDCSYRMWPFIEYCTCTDEEKKAFKDKIYYDGMTVNRIGKISDFIENSYFIKGQLIRLDIGGDAHIANEIYAELAKGAYFE
jgi:hypothetical protein